MTTGGYWGDVVEGSPRSTRRKMIERDFIPYVKEIFAKRSELTSAMLLLAQYWADEADDAVHANVVFSGRETPLWPHPCRWDDEDDDSVVRDPNEICTSCGDVGWLSFDDNGEQTIAAFAPCCREDADQEMRVAEAYLPYAVARRSPSAKDGVEVEIVGGPIRAWMDDESTFPRPVKRRHYDDTTLELFDLVYKGDEEARQVLADRLQQKGDPLGEYITLSYALADAQKGKGLIDPARREELHTRAAALEMRHGRTWLGPLAQVAPAEYVVFDRGFVRAIAVHFPNDAVAQTVSSAREWGTVQRLRFLPSSIQRLDPSMLSLRFVGPLDARGLQDLHRLHAELPAVERIHVILENDAMLSALADKGAPSGLRCLIVGSAPGGPGRANERRRNPFTGLEQEIPSPTSNLTPGVLAPLLRAEWWRQLDEVVITSTSPAVLSSWLDLSRDERPKIVSFTSTSVSHMTAGFRVRVKGYDDPVAAVDMPSLNADIGLRELGDLLAALPSRIRVELASTRVYAPTDDELATLSLRANRTVTRAQ